MLSKSELLYSKIVYIYVEICNNDVIRMFHMQEFMEGISNQQSWQFWYTHIDLSCMIRARETKILGMQRHAPVNRPHADTRHRDSTRRVAPYNTEGVGFPASRPSRWYTYVYIYMCVYI